MSAIAPMSVGYTSESMISENYLDNNPPSIPEVDGETSPDKGVEYDYDFTSTDPDGDDISFYIDWGDENNTGWIGPITSGEIISASHAWTENGIYIFRAKAKDHPYEAESDWFWIEIKIPNINKETNLDRHLYAEYYDAYSIEEIPERIRPYVFNEAVEEDTVDVYVNVPDVFQPPTQSYDGLMDSAWPMYCHDTRHTGRSPYSTANNNGYKKWEIYHQGIAQGGIAIAEDKTIYHCIGDNLNARYPNGTLKWTYDVDGWIQQCCPAIADDGTIYVGTVSPGTSYLYAINPDGSRKWRYSVGGDDIYSSPAIGEDGTIYFGSGGGYDPWHGHINALFPNGTVRWRFKTGAEVYSSPVIGDDGTIYCGSHDGYLYALYPDGTLKWKYKTGWWVRTAPCIGDDGIIYAVSLDDYLYAINPDGTLKWKSPDCAGTSPTIGQDGTIYCGFYALKAIDPTDGSKKWTFPVDGSIEGGTPCNSADGTIYFGTEEWEAETGEIIALNPDGTLKWKKTIGMCQTPPAIGEDGTVYIGARGLNEVYLYAIGYAGPNPLTPEINGPSSGKPDTSYDYTFTSIDPDGDDVQFFIDWGDGDTEWTELVTSGTPITKGHKWDDTNTFEIKAKAKDSTGLESDWATLEVSMPRNRLLSNTFFMRFLERFPNAFPLLRQILL